MKQTKKPSRKVGRETLTVRFSEKEIEHLNRASLLEGKPRAEFIRHHAVSAALELLKLLAKEEILAEKK